jgi:tRNA(fMet)-specific endonuclease VapC
LKILETADHSLEKLNLLISFLLDTNIAIFYMKGLFDLKEKFRKIPLRNVYISEITLAELKFGVEKSLHIEKNKTTLEDFLCGVQIIPINDSIDLFAKEKARLQKLGTTINDFDLLIAVTAVTHNLIMVTNNTKHFKNVQHIKLEDWTITSSL